MLKNILGRIFACWVVIAFVFTMLFALLFIWLTGGKPEPARTKSLTTIFRHWMTAFFFLTGVRLKVFGKEKFIKDQNYVIVSNHSSLMDVPLTSARIPGANKTIAKIEMAKVPVFGMIYKRGSILVDRKNPNSRRDSFIKMKQVLEMGIHMVIYPEGTRNKTGKPLKEFHDGAFRLACDSSKPIMPVIIYGTAKMLPSEKTFYFLPGRLEMHFLDPILVEQTDTTETLKEKTFRSMWDYYERNDPKEAVGSRQ